MEEFKIVRFDLVSSTQDVARQIMRPGVVVVADAQTKGRGRRGREWSSPPGGLWMTAILETGIPPNLLSLGAGAAVSRSLEKFGYKTCLKWPNDVMMDGRKLAGIIGERHGNLVLLGIGINLRNEIQPELRDVATGIPELEREELLPELLKSLGEMLSSDILSLWRRYQCTLGRMVVVDGITGIAEDLDEEGFLILRRGEERIRISSGTLRFLEKL